MVIFRYIFLEYSAPSHAHEAVKNADGYKLDKQHTFRVNLFTDFDKYVPLLLPYTYQTEQVFKNLF